MVLLCRNMHYNHNKIALVEVAEEIRKSLIEAGMIVSPFLLHHAAVTRRLWSSKDTIMNLVMELRFRNFYTSKQKYTAPSHFMHHEMQGEQFDELIRVVEAFLNEA